MKPDSTPRSSRRDWLRVSLAGVGAIAAGGVVNTNTAAEGSTSRKRSLRLAHFTDVHVQPERDAGEGMVKCLRHIQSQKDAPSLVLNTGDCVMDTNAQDAARTDLQWSLFQKTMAAECSLPVESCLGNHDIWGWNKSQSKTTGTEPGWGKQRGLDALGLAKPYHSFDRGGWHIIMLDSVALFGEKDFVGRLDDEQFDWLVADLAANSGKHTLVASHMPIFSAAAVLRSESENAAVPGAFTSTGALSHLDGRKLHEAFLRAGNVRACISGHLHVSDRAEFCGIHYLSNPAVSGDWWRGKNLGRFAEMYTLMDLNDDGTVEIEYVPYGWEARLLPDEKPRPPYPPPATNPTTKPGY